jgi:hypothetical protein
MFVDVMLKYCVYTKQMANIHSFFWGMFVTVTVIEGRSLILGDLQYLHGCGRFAYFEESSLL